MEKVFNRLFTPVSFKMLMIVISFISMCPIFKSSFSGYMKYGLLFGILSCGWLLIKYNKKIIEFDAVNYLLLAFWASYLITILINKEYFVLNAKQYVYMFVLFFLLFVVNNCFCDKEVITDFKLISILLVVITAVSSLITFYLYLINFSDVISLFEGDAYGLSVKTLYVIGLYEGRLYGLFNPNATAMIDLISIICSVYLLLIFNYKGKRIVEVLLCFNVLIQYVCILLTGTRGVLYGSLFVISIISIVCLSKRIKISRRLFRTVTVLLCTTAIIVLLIVLSVAINKLVSYMPTLVAYYKPVSSQITMEANPMFEDLDMLFSDNEKRAEFSTGRFEIWIAALKVFHEAPVFGFSREGLVRPVYDYLVQTTYNEGSAIVHSGLHNIYLTVLLSSGTVGFLLLASVVICALYKTIYVFVKSSCIDIHLMISFVVSISFFIIEFVESRILYQVNFFNIVFWIFFGYLYYFSNKGYKAIKFQKELVE